MFSMKITFLGTGTSQGVPVIGCPCKVCNSLDPLDIRLRSSALITVGSQNILIDAGPDLRQQLLNNKITQVDAILMTHEHKDHTAGLDDVRPLNFMTRKVMQIYGLQRVLNVIRKDYDYAFKKNKYPGSPEFQLNMIKDEVFTIGDLLIEPIAIQHLTLPILGYKINNMAYITDASFIAPSEISKVQNLDLLVINALRHKEHYSHFNLTQAIQVIKEINPKRAYLTHISHEMGKYVDVAPTLPDNIFMAYDGLEVEI